MSTRVQLQRLDRRLSVTILKLWGKVNGRNPFVAGLKYRRYQEAFMRLLRSRLSLSLVRRAAGMVGDGGVVCARCCVHDAEWRYKERDGRPEICTWCLDQDASAELYFWVGKQVQ